MQDYEIRLLTPEGPLVHVARHLGDFHAIRRAQRLRLEDDGLEVWRDGHCIYRDVPALRHRAA